MGNSTKLHTISLHNMASGGFGHCMWCAKDLREANLHGQLVHVGMCQRKREVAVAAAEATRKVSQVAAPMPALARAMPPDVAAIAEPDTALDELNDTDKALLLLFYERTDIKVSLMREIIAISRMPEPPSFRSERDLLKTVDALPGPKFNVLSLTVPPLPATFPLLARDVGEIALGLLQRFNGRICDPQTRRDPASGTTDFVDGDRYQELLQTLAAACPDEDAVLVPLIFNAGMKWIFHSHIWILQG